MTIMIHEIVTIKTPIPPKKMSDICLTLIRDCRNCSKRNSVQANRGTIS